jgi:hypothetical protein
MADNTSPSTTMFYQSGIDTIRDPVRSTRWRMFFGAELFKALPIKPTNGTPFDGEAGTDEVSIHIKSSQIPGVRIDLDKIWYMGFPSNYATNVQLEGDIPVEFIMTEDMRSFELVYAWVESVINAGILVNPTGGASRTAEAGRALGLGTHKDAQDSAHTVVRNSGIIKTNLYNWHTGAEILTVNLINAIPTSIDPTSLQYQQGQLVSFRTNIHYDRFSLSIPTPYSAG